MRNKIINKYDHDDDDEVDDGRDYNDVGVDDSGGVGGGGGIVTRLFCWWWRFTRLTPGYVPLCS